MGYTFFGRTFLCLLEIYQKIILLSNFLSKEQSFGAQSISILLKTWFEAAQCTRTKLEDVLLLPQDGVHLLQFRMSGFG